MKNKILIFIITLTTLFFYQAKSWAVANNTEFIRHNINVTIDKSIFLASDPSPAIYEQKTPHNINLWIASYFIPGLGQMLMGDFLRGFQFTILCYAANFLFIMGSLILYGELVSRQHGPIEGFMVGPISTSVGLILSYLLYFLNVSNAYKMSEEIKIKEFEDSSWKVSNIKASDNGISFTAFSF